jgi:hypothetical protein
LHASDNPTIRRTDGELSPPFFCLELGLAQGAIGAPLLCEGRERRLPVASIPRMRHFSRMLGGFGHGSLLPASAAGIRAAI